MIKCFPITSVLSLPRDLTYNGWEETPRNYNLLGLFSYQPRVRRNFVGDHGFYDKIPGILRFLGEHSSYEEFLRNRTLVSNFSQDVTVLKVRQ